MNIELRKKKLINWIGELHDDKTIKRLETLQNASDEWPETLSDIEIKLIDAGIAAIDAGEVHAHQMVMEEAIAYLKKAK